MIGNEVGRAIFDPMQGYSTIVAQLIDVEVDHLLFLGSGVFIQVVNGLQQLLLLVGGVRR